MSSIPKIVILGAGYGGILTAQRLQKELNYNEADVTLVNRHDYHYITTHLHMPAAGTDSIENTRVSISKLIDEFKIDLVKSSVQEIRLHDKKVILEDGTLSYDYLVIGLGGEPETFGIPGLAEHAMTIRSINSVRLIREHIEYQFALYKNERRPQERINFVVGGAGFSGIEFVAELADRIPRLCKEYDVDPTLVNIYNVEAAPAALPGFAPELVEYAMNVLEKKGVTFKMGIAIKECLPGGVVLNNGEEIRAATVVWTGGIRGNRLVEAAGFETMRGRVKVDEYLRAPGYENIYIIGDNSLIFNEEGRPYPPTAQMAMQQGVCCAQNIVAAIRDKSMRKFEFSNKGTVASLGRGEGIAVVGDKKYQGWKAAQLKKLVDLRYLFIIGGIPLVLKKGRFL
ncbi:FAD-dependent pyridine nucleotide-disulfide oxidoreductase [Paenibacillus vortex V453]|jgi:NADH dehydrogenase|uniref:NADH dehydrogenase n=2 Tax=Paenibacillus TaxID=44249 RepID=A0A163H4M9_9BACL|nr:MULTISPECIES: NAD(P)/FAD-dependent oxidoreductase [Paenibacillus]ANA79373.1 NADH dehydrogenase [Paenibacillus glucanolyticus]AVV56681.1 NAD(P)/FAD-dependent oxidoreductase [Paenibacillus glucanolyticus]AWP25845.1 FAD-dependent oxidoreductase [Paenibacillus sp. Cedars]EFU38733.1 FAD-dependent pyridine nucleotide-disulfide oxidoreductase [Paenibacillus vortex V453]ETT29776.1 FAD-dependent pyridine nucleotide-disulfide oxidoreductase [Paenibacillus sp. FSL R5-808]